MSVIARIYPSGDFTFSWVCGILVLETVGKTVATKGKDDYKIRLWKPKQSGAPLGRPILSGYFR